MAPRASCSGAIAVLLLAALPPRPCARGESCRCRSWR
uniref:Uncharacterized protein n=1 Tax=Arundo donax TaxID=35708 RepID=A0A0A9GRT9_ARUDO